MGDLLGVPFNRTRIPALKAALRLHGLRAPAAARKRDLYDALQAHLLAQRFVHVDPSALAAAATRIQAVARGWRVRRLHRSRGPGAICRAACNNSVDPVTLTALDEVADADVFSFRDGDGKVYGFELASLADLLRHGQHTNPFTRAPLPDAVLEQVQLLSTAGKAREPVRTAPVATTEAALAQKAFELFHDFYLLTGCFVDERWLLDLSRAQLILLYRQLYELWRYGTDMSPDTRRRFVPPGSAVLTRVNDVCFRRVYNRPALLRVVLEEFETLTTNAPDRDDRCTAVMWCLIALTQVSAAAAVALPHLVMY